MDRWADDVARAKAGDRAAQTTVVLGNQGLVHKGAWCLRRYPGVDVEDLVAEGMLGLLDAIRAHDPLRGTVFTTTASYWIRLRQFDAVRSARALGATTRSQFAGRIWFSGRAMWDRACSADDPVSAFADEAEARGLDRPSRAAVIDALALLAGHDRLDDPDRAPVLPSSSRDPEDLYACAELAHAMRCAVAALPPAERDLIERAVMGDESLTDAAGGGTTRKARNRARMRADRIRLKAIERLRREFVDADEHRRAA